MVSVPSGVSGLPGSDPSVGGGGSAQPPNQGGSPLRVAAGYHRYVNKQVSTGTLLYIFCLNVPNSILKMNCERDIISFKLVLPTTNNTALNLQ